MSHNITVEGGKTVKLLTAGKYCDQDIIVTAEGSNTDEAYETGYAAGAQSEYDKLWDAYQDNGKRTNYDSAFSGVYWTQDSLRPKYDIKATSIGSMFADNTNVTDLVEILERSGIVFDTSQVKSAYRPFRYCSKLKRVPPLDVTSINSLDYMFMNCIVLESAGFLNVQETCDFGSPFGACGALVDVIITGTIGKNASFNSNHNLSKASLIGIINAVHETNAITVTLSLRAVNKAFATSEGAADGSTSAEWNTLVATRPNCTISLV